MERKVIVGIAVAVMLVTAPLAYLVLTNDEENDDDTEKWLVGHYLEYTEVVFEVGSSMATHQHMVVSFRRWGVPGDKDRTTFIVNVDLRPPRTP